MTDFTVTNLEAQLEWTRDQLAALKHDYAKLERALDDSWDERQRAQERADKLEAAIRLCRFSIKNNNHVSGAVADDWVRMLDESLASPPTATEETKK